MEFIYWYVILTFLIKAEVSADTRSVKMTQFERNSAFDDSTCLSQDLLISTDAGSLYWCLTICSEEDECKTVFYDQKKRQCHQCTARYSPTSLPTFSDGFIHFNKQLQDCDDGWAEFQDSCYSLSPAGTFQDVVNYCHAFSAHPVYVETSDENEFLKSFLTIDHLNVYWYIGMTDSTQDGEWRYYNTERLMSFLDFYISEPNDDASNSQQCGMFVGFFNYQWADHYCTDYIPTVCEKSR